MEYGMLINYGYCTGCKSCEISCRKEKEISLEEWGIKVQQQGPEILDGAWEWDYLPVPSRICDYCEDRKAQGKKAACELHCLANVIEILPIDELAKRMNEMRGTKAACFVQ